MKISYVVATPDIKTPEPLGLNGPLEESLRAVSKAGYEAVEFMVRDPKVLDWKEIKSLLRQYSLEVSAITTGGIYAEDGLSLLSDSSDIRELASTRLIEVIDFAGALDTKINIGTFRGKIPRGWTKESSETHLLELLATAADHASLKNVRLMIEPITRILNDLFNDTQESISFIQKLNRENVGLELDLFHVNIEERSITHAFKNSGPFLWHIHICDNNRKPPGYGHLPFGRILNALKKHGFEGYLSIEAYQWPDPETALNQSINFLRSRDR